MPRVINDSDDEEDLEALSDHDHEHMDVDNKDEDGQQPQPPGSNLQSTGSTERMLKQAHVLMMDSVTPDHRSAATPHSGDHPTPTPNKLKRSKTSTTGIEDVSHSKRRKTEPRRDDWDVPLSSPSKQSSAKSAKSGRAKTQAMVIITEPGSTIMDSTSSDERRARELRETPMRAGDSAVTLEHNPQLESCTPAPVEVPSPTAASHKEKQKRRPTSQNEDDQEADELSIGLPKEQYHPRPSRSRSHQLSARVAPATDDHSVTQQMRVKRRKTVDVVRDADCAALMDMGFENTQAVKALQETDGNVGKAADWLLDGADHEGKENKEDSVGTVSMAKPVAKDKTPRTRGRPKKEAVVENEREDGDADQKENQESKTGRPAGSGDCLTADSTEIGDTPLSCNGTGKRTVDDEEKDDELVDKQGSLGTPQGSAIAGNNTHSVNGKEAPSTRRRSGKLRVVIDDEDEEEVEECEKRGDDAIQGRVAAEKEDDPPADDDEHSEAKPAAKTTNGKKRGRGRPKKQSNVEAAEDELSSIVKNKHGQNAHENGEDGPDAYQSTSNEPDKDEMKDPPCASTPPQPLKERLSRFREELPQDASSATTEKPPMSPSKISPIKSGKVPLRVGLSKRMRIPSLLRSARK